MTRLQLTGDQSQSLVTTWESGPLPTQELEQQAYRLFTKDYGMWLWPLVMSQTRNDYRERVWRATTTEPSAVADPRDHQPAESEAGE